MRPKERPFTGGPIPASPLAAADTLVVAAAFVVAAALLVAAGGRARAVELTGRAALGYDTFIDRFTILEADTVESIEELYLGLGGWLALGSANRLSIGNLCRVGTQTIDDNLDLDAATGPGPSRLALRGTVRLKHFQPGSDYESGNDYVQTNAALQFRREVSERLRMKLQSRFELIDYEDLTIFDYDYSYADVGAEIEAGSSFENAVQVGGAFGHRDVPDTTALSYDRVLAELEARLTSARGAALRVSSLGDRKSYRESVRSSSWSVLSFVDLDMNTLGAVAWSLRLESELTLYDRPDTIYFDTHFLRGGVKLRFPIGAASGVFVEPRYARMLCGDFPEERYWEGSTAVGVDLMRNGDFWVHASYEPGYRGYSLDPNELYSDFWFHRLSLMANVPLPAEMSLGLFVTHDPERHSRRVDDFSVTLVTAEVTRRF